MNTSSLHRNSNYRAIIAGMLFLVSGILFAGGKEEQRFSDAHFALGTVCTITLYGRSNEAAFKGAFDLVDEIESKMSVSITGSEVGLINKAAGSAPVIVSGETFFVIEESLKYSALSDGAFDITVQPLVDLWGIGTEFAQIPSTVEIESAVNLIGYRDVEMNRRDSSVFLNRTGMAVDLGGIAKGYATDRVKDYFLDLSFKTGILNFGGNIVTFGRKSGGDPWVIGIQDPFDSRGKPIGTVEFSGGAVVTSGIYERYFERNGIRYHHILDPVTGFPVENEIVSISIIADRGIVADVFSTIAFALGVTKGIGLLETIPSLDGIFITKEREVYITSGIKETFLVTNEEYFLRSLDN
ncbi:MAG: FAD:protein FMN transferase [Spirochaetales bacterium]|nr:FAD:protein FMN transferase [Spirochaetales bacterium]